MGLVHSGGVGVINIPPAAPTAKVSLPPKPLALDPCAGASVPGY